MLLTVMIVCAVAAVVLFATEAFGDLRDVWTHPEHRPPGDDLHYSSREGDRRRRQRR